jgi:hypothetical protein
MRHASHLRSTPHECKRLNGAEFAGRAAADTGKTAGEAMPTCWENAEGMAEGDVMRRPGRPEPP